MRILHCPTVVGGNPPALAKAERALGHQSISIAYTPTNFGHRPDRQLWNPDMSFITRELLRWKLLLKAFWCFDVIHYNFGSPILRWQTSQATSPYPTSIISWFEKKYVRFCFKIESMLLRKKVIAVTYQGDDARQREYSLRSFKFSIAKEVNPNYYPTGSDDQKRSLIDMFDRTADLIYSLNPDLLYVLPDRAKFIPYGHVDLNQWKLSHYKRPKIPVVLHAPSHQDVKGTRYIIEAVNQLKMEGIDFNFVLVENVNNQEAKKLYEDCDLVIDQLLAGWYGGFAVEVMALGKPVICYIREEDTKFVPKNMMLDLPIIQGTPETIKQVLREYLTTKVDTLSEIGKKSRVFVEKWHDSEQIARSIIKDYQAIFQK